MLRLDSESRKQNLRGKISIRRIHGGQIRDKVWSVWSGCRLGPGILAVSLRQQAQPGLAVSLRQQAQPEGIELDEPGRVLLVVSAGIVLERHMAL